MTMTIIACIAASTNMVTTMASTSSWDISWTITRFDSNISTSTTHYSDPGRNSITISVFSSHLIYIILVFSWTTLNYLYRSSWLNIMKFNFSWTDSYGLNICSWLWLSDYSCIRRIRWKTSARTSMNMNLIRGTNWRNMRNTTLTNDCGWVLNLCNFSIWVYWRFSSSLCYIFIGIYNRLAVFRLPLLIIVRIYSYSRKSRRLKFNLFIYDNFAHFAFQLFNLLNYS